VFWYGNNLGQYFSYNPLTAITGGVRDVLACYERAAELDETYMGGGPHRSLAALIAQAFFVLGKSRDEALPHYERSIEIDPNYLESYVNYAQHYAIPKGMTELASSLLQTLSEKAKDPAVVAAWPLYNTLAIRRAESLLR
jgi:tetratricopeptide (TPR) repeat protein